MATITRLPPCTPLLITIAHLAKGCRTIFCVPTKLGSRFGKNFMIYYTSTKYKMQLAWCPTARYLLVACIMDVKHPLTLNFIICPMHFRQFTMPRNILDGNNSTNVNWQLYGMHYLAITSTLKSMEQYTWPKASPWYGRQCSRYGHYKIITSTQVTLNRMIAANCRPSSIRYSLRLDTTLSYRTWLRTLTPSI